MANLRNGLCLALLLLAWQAPARAQQDMNFPPTGYYLGFNAFHAGDYRDALGIFQASLRSGVRSTEGRWVDAICYHTMIGECFYQMGDVAKALEQYDMAVKLAVVHNNWMLRVQFPNAIEPSGSTVRSTITWGATKRPTALARIPDRMGTVQGQSDAANMQAIERGGVVATTTDLSLERQGGGAMHRRGDSAPAGIDGKLSAATIR
jgi:hypothetical protein